MAKQFDTEKIFVYHAPFGTQQERFIALRGKAKELADLIQGSCPPSREMSTALTNIQQAVMWANAAIAINEQEPIVEPVVLEAGV